MADRPVEELSVKELKEVIRAAGLSAVGITEKAELRSKAREARARLETAKTPTPGVGDDAHPWRPRYDAYNGATPGDAELAVILLHGIGASAEDLVPLGAALAARMPHRTMLVACPGAPSESAWWPLNPQEWMMRAMQGETGLAQMIRDEPPGLAACRPDGAALVEHVRKRAGGRATLVLGGFSQGAMTATDIALHLDTDAADGILHVSGAPLVVDDWNRRLRDAATKPRVYVSHGRNDFLLPFAVSGWTQTLFRNAGCDVTYAPHDGAHDVGPIDPAVAFLEATVAAKQQQQQQQHGENKTADPSTSNGAAATAS